MKEEQTPLIGDIAEEAPSGEGSAAADRAFLQQARLPSPPLHRRSHRQLLRPLRLSWFPYLAAKYGGGMFLLCYVALAATFGFCLLILEIAIGRKTGKGVIGAFAALNKKFKWLGFFCLVVPIIIVPYYSVIGGWVLKYVWAFATGDTGSFGDPAAAGEYFSAFTGVVTELTSSFM